MTKREFLRKIKNISNVLHDETIHHCKMQIHKYNIRAANVKVEDYEMYTDLMRATEEYREAIEIAYQRMK